MKDLIGKRFGMLTVIARADDHVSSGGFKMRTWLCKCDCGNEKVVKECNLIYGRQTKSCGCRQYYQGQHTKLNKYDLSGDYGIGYFANGTEFYFDKEDYNLIKDYKWELHNGYARASKYNGDKKYIKMHRLIMGVLDKGFNKDEVIDHINRNKLDNRKENLRIVDVLTNCRNKNKYDKNGKRVGVNKLKNSKWSAIIGVNGKILKLGTFDNYEDAVKARDEGEKTFWGVD